MNKQTESSYAKLIIWHATSFSEYGELIVPVMKVFECPWLSTPFASMPTDEVAEAIFNATNGPRELLTPEVAKWGESYYACDLRTISTGDVIEFDGLRFYCGPHEFSKIPTEDVQVAVCLVPSTPPN